MDSGAHDAGIDARGEANRGEANRGDANRIRAAESKRIVGGAGAPATSPHLSRLSLPDRTNYVAAFLSLHCNLDCHYCINLHEDFAGGRRRIVTRHMNADEWIAAFSRIPHGNTLPITLQGGEPTVHKEFYDIVAGVEDGTQFDLLTNLTFDVNEFVRRVPVSRFDREAPYAPIRVSYHPGQNKMSDLIPRALRLEEHGFRVGIYGVLHPDQRDEILRWQEKAHGLGVDFRTKEYLGVDDVGIHGHYKYPDAITKEINHYCECRTTELLIAPSGYVFRCHSDLYEARTPIGHLLDPEFDFKDEFRPCFVYGHCNPCDVKIKTNRFQNFGHTSVDIRNRRALDADEDARRRAGDNGLGRSPALDIKLPPREAESRTE